MKYLILGDLHCREIWKDIVAKEGDSCDKIIFLGDYLPPRGFTYDDPTDACGFLYSVLDYKDQNPDKVVLLRGNHCMEMLGYYWARCYPKVHPKVAEYCQSDDVKNWFLNNTQWIYRIPNTSIVCSHAGLGKKFLSNAHDALERNKIRYYSGIPTPWDWIIDNINKLEPSPLFGFTDNNPFDTNGESSCQPCTWIRPYTLLQYGNKNTIHVVGHTPVDHICNFKKKFIDEARQNDENFEEKKEEYEDYAEVWCCDCLENREYLIIEDWKFKTCKL